MALPIRTSVRSLLQTPGVTALVVFTLAVGIAVVTGMFTLINGWAWAALPYDEADRIVALNVQWARDPSPGQIPADLVPRIRALPGIFTDVAAYDDMDRTIRFGQTTTTATITRAEATLFPLLRMTPRLGRAFSADDPDNVAILTQNAWRRDFAASPSVLGSTLYIDGAAHTIIGIMPEEFALDRAEIIVPLRLRQGEYAEAIARLAPGISADAARNRIATLAVPVTEPGDAGAQVGLNEDMLQRVSVTRAGFMLILFGAATAFVLLIACGNVVTVMLARGVVRRPSYAIRAALGASRRRLGLENLTESAIIATVSTVLGVMLASWMVNIFVSRLGQSFPSWLHFPIDAHVAMFAGLAALFVMLSIGWLPAREAGRAGPISLLNRTTATNNIGDVKFGRRLVAAEVALSVALFFGTVLMARSFGNAQSFSVGYDDSNVAMAQVNVNGGRFRTLADVDEYVSRAMAELRRIPSAGVTYEGRLSAVRMSGGDTVSTYGLYPDMVAGAITTKPYEYRVIDESYFKALDIEPVTGRTFTTHDTKDAPAVAVLSQSLAAKLWPGLNAIGRTFRLELPDPVVVTVVGVVPDVNQLRSNMRGMMVYHPEYVYLPAGQAVTHAPTFMVKGANENTVLHSLTEALRRADPDIAAFGRAKMLYDANHTHSQEIAIMGSLFGGLATLALVLSMIGLFGVIAYSARQRTREIGVRMALGAAPRRIAVDVMLDALRLIAFGLAGGFLLAALIGQVMGSMLLDVSSIDPLTYVVVATAFTAIALLAAWLPSRRAMLTNPMNALRPE